MEDMFKPMDFRKQPQPQAEPRGHIQPQVPPQRSLEKQPPSLTQSSERSPYEMLDDLFKFVQQKQQK
jgi:hypothetical protein